MTTDDKTLRRALCLPTSTADQAGATVRTRLPEVFGLRDRLIDAARSGTLPELLGGLSDFEASVLVACVVFSSVEVFRASLESGLVTDDGDDSELVSL